MKLLSSITVIGILLVSGLGVHVFSSTDQPVPVLFSSSAYCDQFGIFSAVAVPIISSSNTYCYCFSFRRILQLNRTNGRSFHCDHHFGKWTGSDSLCYHKSAIRKLYDRCIRMEFYWRFTFRSRECINNGTLLAIDLGDPRPIANRPESQH